MHMGFFSSAINILQIPQENRMPNGNTVKYGWISLLCVPLYIAKRSEAVLQWGKEKISKN